MTCKKCGAELSEDTAFCPKCGQKIKNNKDEKEYKGGGIPSWIFSIILLIAGLTSIADIKDFSSLVFFLVCFLTGLIVMPPIAKLIYKLTKFKTTWWEKVLFPFALTILLAIIAAIFNIPTGNENVPKEEKVEEQTKENEETSKEDKEKEYYENALFYGRVIDNYQSYIDKEVKLFVTVKIYDKSSKTITTDYNDKTLTIKLKKKENLEENQNLVISGKLTFDEDKDELKINKAKAIVTGTVTDQKYEESKNAYLEELRLAEEKRIEEERLAAQKKIDDFKNSAVDITYDELYRYPEKYQSQAIKCTITISDIDVSTSIFKDDTIYSKLNGKEIFIKDERDNKEPKLATGDYITIYGYGGGNGVEYEYRKGSGFLGTSLGAEKRNEHYVPIVKATIIEFH